MEPIRIEPCKDYSEAIKSDSFFEGFKQALEMTKIFNCSYLLIILMNFQESGKIKFDGMNDLINVCSNQAFVQNARMVFIKSVNSSFSKDQKKGFLITPITLKNELIRQISLSFVLNSTKKKIERLLKKSIIYNDDEIVVFKLNNIVFLRYRDDNGIEQTKEISNYDSKYELFAFSEASKQVLGDRKGKQLSQEGLSFEKVDFNFSDYDETGLIFCTKGEKDYILLNSKGEQVSPEGYRFKWFDLDDLVEFHQVVGETDNCEVVFDYEGNIIRCK